EAVSISYGGSHGDRVMIEAKGVYTPQIVEKIRDQVPDHKVTRVDAAHDVDDPDAWETLLGVVLEVKAKYRLKGERGGDWDFPEDGRTQYLGAPSSPIRTRLYEKGKQPEYRHCSRPGWVRLEAQVRPKGDAKTAYSTISPI
ncbi:replication initiation factor domain-containing protein, partial [Macrococcoides canis]